MALQVYLWVKNWLAKEEGQDVVEYAVLVIFIAIFIFIAVGLFGQEMSNIYNAITEAVSSGLNP